MLVNLNALLRFAVILVLLTLAVTYLAWGQGAVTTGTISGDITDASGAVLPGAKIAVHNQATGLRRDAVADGNGHFVLSQLPAGRYDISVTATGFKEAVMHGFQLNVDAAPNLKFALNLGSVEQKVDVSAEGAQVAIELSKTEVSNVIQEIQVRQLPINQRSFTALVTQEPGLVTMTNSAAAANANPLQLVYTQGSMISANGHASQSMAYLVDGVNINNSAFGAPGTAAGGDVPGVEGIQEFKVLAQNYSAAYGGSSGAVVSFATRSGTNEFHGSAYEFLRNDVLDAREFFNRYPDKKAPYRRNQFGATFGGPIKKDKTFFFMNYEALLSRLTTTGVGTVPTVAARNGGGDGSDGRFPVFDPWGNATEISPDVKAVLGLYPLPNGLDFGNGIAEVIFPNYQPVNQHYGLVRFDQVLSSKDTLMARYTVTDARGSNVYYLPTWGLTKESRLQGLSLKWTRTISNNLVNTLSAAAQRSMTYLATGALVPVPAAAYTGNVLRKMVGGINVGSAGGGGQVSSLGSDTWGPYLGIKNTFPVNDDLMWIRGNHTLKFGGQFVPTYWNSVKQSMAGGNWNFANLNDLLAGAPQILFIFSDGSPAGTKYKTNQIAWYVEDSWRLTSNLTLTLGLRHEFQAPLLKEAHNPARLGNFASYEDTTLMVGSWSDNYTKKQFSPRIGIAYDPFKKGKTVIRAGFGMFYDFVPWEMLTNRLSHNLPEPALLGHFGITVLPPGMRGTSDNPAMPPIPFPGCPAGPNGTSSCTVKTGYAGMIEMVKLPMRSPTSLQWNLQLERELPGSFKVSATYTGSHSYNIQRGQEGNSSKPCSIVNGRPYFGAYAGQCGTYGSAFAAQAFALYSLVFDGQSIYNAGTFSVSRKFGSGISFNTSYTFAKATSSVDTAEQNSITYGNAGNSAWPENPAADWSESMFSIRHRFTTNGIFELPFGKGRLIAGDASGLKQALIGGWAFNPLLEIRSGIPFSVLNGIAISNAGDVVLTPDRPNILRPNPVLGGIDQYFDPSAFALQEPGYLGTAPRNSVRGPGYAVVDLSLTKQFKTSERTNLEFRAESFNLINHPNFDLPYNKLFTRDAQGNIVADPQAGRISRTVGTPRQLQFALKFTF